MLRLLAGLSEGVAVQSEAIRIVKTEEDDDTVFEFPKFGTLRSYKRKKQQENDCEVVFLLLFSFHRPIGRIIF